MGFILALLLLVSSFVRGYSLASVPPELFGDEIDVGIQAKSLLATGHDLYGQTLPIYVHSFSEWRAPLLMYATVPSVLIFGNTEWGVRLPQVVFGSLAPILLYFLVSKASSSKNLGLASAFFLALLPWHIQYSRAAFEVVILLDMVILGALMFLRRNYILSAVFFALTFYTYSTAVVFTPLFVVAILLWQKRLPSFISIVTFIVVVSPFVYTLTLGHASDRFQTLSLYNSPELLDTIVGLRNSQPGLVGTLFHNKFETIPRRFLDNYLRSFSTEFLFVRGDPTVRQSIQFIGELIPISAPLLLIGIYFLISRRHFFWLAWLLIAPIPSALTIDGSWHATRLFVMIPPLTVALGSGFLLLKKPLKIIMIFLLFINMSLAANYYLTQYPKVSWRWWHVGFKSALTEVSKLSSEYSRVFINNTYEPSLGRFLFYTNYSPYKFQQKFTLDQSKNDIVPGYNGFTLDNKFFFGSFSDQAKQLDMSKRLLPNSLYMISQLDDVAGDWDWRKNPPTGIRVLFTSVNPYDQPVFYLITKSL